MKNTKEITLLAVVLTLAFTACNRAEVADESSEVKVIKGLYSYGPEIRSFTDCDEGREYWVADSAKTLELAYNDLNFEKPYVPVYIEVEGRVVKSDSTTVTANFDSTLVVTKVLKLTTEIPDGLCN
jgi:copper homeostasis protein (lipoprotein)